MEERDETVVLIDEDGEEVEFEHLDTLEMNGNRYVVLLPIEQEDGENAEVVILKVEENDEHEENFVSIEDEDELNRVFEEFRTRIKDEFCLEGENEEE